MVGATPRQFQRSFWLPVLAILGIVAWPVVSIQAQSGPTVPAAGRQTIDPSQTLVTTDAKTPLQELLPVPPKIKDGEPGFAADLTQVPEVHFQALPEKEVLEKMTQETKRREALEKTKQMIANINRLNNTNRDGFVEALRGERSDLRALPYAMGDACRTLGERNRCFAAAARGARAILQNITTDDLHNTIGDVFWSRYLQGCALQAAAVWKIERSQQEHVMVSRVHALMQVLAPESADMRLGLVKYLATVPHPESSRALAKMAVFSAEEEIRQAAVDALKGRNERDFTDTLVQGLRYPWPAVATRACDVLVKLKRKDLLPLLVDLLDDPDPRAPVVKEAGTKKVHVIRELVRINHQRSCLLCHSPGDARYVPTETLTAEIPLPDQPFSLYAQLPIPGISVRIDVTYLRQDFSMFQAVPNPDPRLALQRFDFLVRSRELTEKEAEAFQAKLDRCEASWISPYHHAAVAALRDLTDKNAPPTAAAWRKLLAADTPKGGKKAEDKLQGTWAAKSIEYNGDQVLGDTVKDLKVVISGSKMTVKGEGPDLERYAQFTFKLDPAATPAIMDVTLNAGNDKGTTFEGIYQLKDDEWKLCLKLFGKERPSEFKSPADSNIVLAVFKRQKK